MYDIYIKIYYLYHRTDSTASHVVEEKHGKRENQCDDTRKDFRAAGLKNVIRMTCKECIASFARPPPH